MMINNKFYISTFEAIQGGRKFCPTS